MRLLWALAAASLLLQVAARPTRREPAAFDAVITLQGSRPLDNNGEEASDVAPATGSRTAAAAHRSLLPPQVRAHGGQLIQEGGRFFLVGTSRKEQAALVSSDIQLYSSTDFAHWHAHDSILRNSSITAFPELLPYGHLDGGATPFRIERPKVGAGARGGRGRAGGCCASGGLLVLHCRRPCRSPMLPLHLPQLLYNARYQRWTLFFHLGATFAAALCTAAVVALSAAAPAGLRHATALPHLLSQTRRGLRCRPWALRSVPASQGPTRSSITRSPTTIPAVSAAKSRALWQGSLRRDGSCGLLRTAGHACCCPDVPVPPRRRHDCARRPGRSRYSLPRAQVRRLCWVRLPCALQHGWPREPWPLVSRLAQAAHLPRPSIPACSCPVMRHAVSQLRPDWLDTTGVICSTVQAQVLGGGGARPHHVAAHLLWCVACVAQPDLTPPRRSPLQTGLGAEAPAVFKHSGRHYIFASHLTGQLPSRPPLHAPGNASVWPRLAYTKTPPRRAPPRPAHLTCRLGPQPAHPAREHGGRHVQHVLAAPASAHARPAG